MKYIRISGEGYHRTYKIKHKDELLEAIQSIYRDTPYHMDLGMKIEEVTEKEYYAQPVK